MRGARRVETTAMPGRGGRVERDEVRGQWRNPAPTARRFAQCWVLHNQVTQAMHNQVTQVLHNQVTQVMHNQVTQAKHNQLTNSMQNYRISFTVV